MHPRFASTASRWKAALFRLACIVSLWQAPVPWVHSHAAEVGLQEHLAAFHADADELTTLGWHWHAVLPPWGQAEHSKDAPASTLRVQFSAAISAPVSDLGLAAPETLTFLTVPTVLPQGPPAPESARHFLASLLAEHPAQTVLNVRLC